MKKFLLLAFIVMITATGYPQSSLWNKVTDARISDTEKLERGSTPSRFDVYTLNLHEMQSRLQQAPQRGAMAPSSVIIPIPDGRGGMQHFRVYEASVLHPDLAALNPEIKSYTGQGIEDPTASVRFSITVFGFHAMILSANGTSYTDPYTEDRQYYIVYNKAGLKTARTFGCGVADEPQAEQPDGPPNVQANDGVLRTYRLALASTIEYSAFHVNAAGVNTGTEAEKKAAVLAAMNVTMTRVNGIYERDMSLTMQIVPNNENVIFITSDNLTNNNESTMLNQIQSIINNAIGTANYDIGHVFGTGGGGIAMFGSVCTSNKARGVTGSPFPVGDPFDIDYVAHEMGHQFGASHTFNNSFQRSASTAVEPGSGSTIMAYAGISPPNVQSNSDAYFHTVSLNQMFNFVNGVGSCALTTPNGNSAPVIPVLQSYTIPKSTAFILKGSATDADGDVLTYCWEQVNANGAGSTQDQTPQPTSTSGPNFRSLSPSESPNRYMPRLEDVLNGNLTPTWEVVPAVGRTLNFALTVRDNNVPNGGQTARRDMSVIVNNTAGPFEVTSQSEQDITWNPGTQQTITWNVAGTTANNINTSAVNILLSTDGGQTFSTVLASNTPNDGSETITVPSVVAPFCRIMVEAVGNIYYAVNPVPFSVGATVTTTCTTYTNNTPMAIPDGVGQNQPGALATSVINVPDNVTISDVNVTLNIQHPYIQDLVIGIANPLLDNQPILWDRECENQSANFTVTFDDGAPQLLCNALNGTYSPAEELAGYNGQQSQGNWTLFAADFWNADVGQIASWSLEICSQTVTAGTNEFGLSNFSLYPNPNNGTFTVAFNSESGNDINIRVHDMRGRQVYGNSFDNTGLFSGNVNLEGMQSGVYLVTVQDGSRKEVKKIVIQ